jgi:CRISPR-associated endoribonuclease Cas6
LIYLQIKECGKGVSQLLTRIEIRIEKNEEPINYNMSSLFHGALMEKIETAYVEKLHNNGLKPYSQSIRLTKENTIWSVCTLTKEAKDNIILPLLDKDFTQIEIKHKNICMPVAEKTVTEISYEQLLKETYFYECQKTINMAFTSPTAFKSQDKYIFYPTVRHVFQSLINKFDASSMGSEIGTEEILEQIEDHVVITGYNLRSMRFHLEGTSIPSFMGSIRLKINSTQQMANLIWLLGSYGEYSGTGIKTSLGMGGIRTYERKEIVKDAK